MTLEILDKLENSSNTLIWPFLALNKYQREQSVSYAKVRQYKGNIGILGKSDWYLSIILSWYNIRKIDIVSFLFMIFELVSNVVVMIGGFKKTGIKKQETGIKKQEHQ